MNRCKSLLLFAVCLLAFPVNHEPSFAGSIKGKIQEKLNSQSNIQYEPYYLYGRDSEVLPTSEFQSQEFEASEEVAQAKKKSRLSDKVAEPLLTPTSLTPFAVYNVLYKAEIDENVVTVNGSVVFEVFRKEGWTQIPLVPNTVGLVDAKVNKGKSFIINQGGKYYLMIDKAGRYSLEIEFLIKANREREGGPGSFNVDIMPAPLAQFEFITSEKEVQTFIEPSIKVETSQEGEKTVSWAIMPNTSNVNVRWTKALPKEDITVVQLEPKAYAQVSTNSSVGGGVIKNLSQVDYSILQAEVSSLRLAFPEDVSILNVSGNNLRDWKPLKKDGVQYLEIFLNYGIKGNYTLSVEYEKNIGEGSQVVEAPWIRAVGVERENGFYGIAASTNVELAVKSKQNATEIDTKQLPASIWTSSSNPILLAFKYLNEGFKIEVEITRHEEIPVLIATIDSAENVTLYTKDGKVLTKVTYQVRNNVKQYLKLDIPKSASIWSSFVDGSPVKPAKDDKGNILIPLQKSKLQGQSLNNFPVEIVYLDKADKMQAFGGIKLNLPKTDVPISESYWSVYFPNEYSYFNFGGDVRKVDAIGQGFRYGFAAQGALGGGQSKAVWKTRGRDGRVKEVTQITQTTDQYDPYSQQSNYAADSNAVLNDLDSLRQTVQAEPAAVSKGILPIDIKIPQQGKMYRFSKLLIVEGESPSLSVNYTSIVEKIKKPLKLLIYIAVFAFLWILVVKIKNKK
ncbi:MAG: hypothetical protein HQL27_08870 [Candidatus Omnitrophica bacterium]|nr:hypothetical protein [Candidatus Omnitrophota bacterium]